MKSIFIIIILILSLKSYAQENCDINEDIYKSDSTLIVEKLGKFFHGINDLLEADEEELRNGIMTELLDYFPFKLNGKNREGSIYISIPENSRSKLSVSPYEFFQSLKSTRKVEKNEFVSFTTKIYKNEISQLLIYPTKDNEVNLPYCIIVPCDITVTLDKNGELFTEKQKVDIYFRYNKCDIKNSNPKITMIKNEPTFKSSLVPHKIYSAKEYAQRNSKYEPYIKINVDPNNATLTLDGNTNIKSNELVKVSAGEHTITATLRNYKSKSIVIEAIKSDKPIEASIKLDKNEGTITFICNNSRFWGKKVYVKKRKSFMGVKSFDQIGTLPLKDYKIPYGSYTFSFESESCYAAGNADINIEEGNPEVNYEVVFNSQYYIQEAKCAGLRALGLSCTNNCPRE